MIGIQYALFQRALAASSKQKCVGGSVTYVILMIDRMLM